MENMSDLYWQASKFCTAVKTIYSKSKRSKLTKMHLNGTTEVMLADENSWQHAEKYS